MGVARIFRHLFSSRLGTRRRFPQRTLDAIEAAIAEAERAADAQIRFAIETSLDLPELLRDAPPRERAAEVFARLRVWDSELRNGVLIHVLVADHDVEIVADRAAAARVPPDEWENACQSFEAHYRAGRFHEGSVAGVAAVGALLARHFPRDPGSLAKRLEEQPNQPAML